MFGGNFAPLNWAFCDGQVIPISQNDTLFNLIGTTYGGDGQETFRLPDLQGRFPIHNGTLQGGSTYVIGQVGGTETVTLTTQQLPIHNHAANVNTGAGTNTLTTDAFWAGSALNNFSTAAPSTPMAPTIQPAGGNQPHENMMPFLAVSFIISLYGIFPSQT